MIYRSQRKFSLGFQSTHTWVSNTGNNISTSWTDNSHYVYLKRSNMPMLQTSVQMTQIRSESFSVTFRFKSMSMFIIHFCEKSLGRTKEFSSRKCILRMIDECSSDILRSIQPMNIWKIVLNLNNRIFLNALWKILILFLIEKTIFAHFISAVIILCCKVSSL